MTDEEVGRDDALETGDGADAAPQVGLESPEADAVEQARQVRDTPDVDDLDLPYDADEADRAEQAHVVAADDDDYR